MSIWTLDYWKTTGELALRSAAQFALVGMGVGPVTDAWHLPWKVTVGMAVSGAIVSVLTSLSSTDVGRKPSPLVTATPKGQ
jgi:hypothetical protein